MTDYQKPTRDTETLILQAAENEFLRKGYSGAKTTSIAEAAGVTHAMLHYYFRTKDKLYEKILTIKFGDISKIMLGALGDINLPLKERIRQGIEYHFDFLRENPDLPRFLANELAEHPERINPVLDDFVPKARMMLSYLQGELDRLPGERIDAGMLLSDILSINVFPFMAAPILNKMIATYYGTFDEYLDMRKKENVRTIMHKLKLD